MALNHTHTTLTHQSLDSNDNFFQGLLAGLFLILTLQSLQLVQAYLKFSKKTPILKPKKNFSPQTMTKVSNNQYERLEDRLFETPKKDTGEEKSVIQV